MNRLVAYHHVLFPDGHTEDMQVVEFDSRGRYLSHHPLRDEEPFVEWHGGTLNLRIPNVKR